MAVLSRDADMLRWLLENKVIGDINTPDKNGITPLHIAVTDKA
jgi:ankyrin repeat protein